MTFVEPEQTLVLQSQGGSIVAFGRLVDAHQQALRAFLRRLSGNWAQADDLAQEAFIVAWRQIGKFRTGEALRPWLFGIGYRQFLMAKRSESRRRRRDALAADDLEASVTPELTTDARLDLMRAMQALPTGQRAAVALCLAAEYSHQAAAEILELPLGTVKSHVLRGRAKLLAALGDGDE